MPVKERVEMSKQDPEIRSSNFKEVPRGYSEEEAVEEAERCLDCKNAPCVDGCPVEVDIPAFINLIKEKKFTAAAEKIKEKNSLPAICGRVCPQEEQCEKVCTLGKRFEPVAIGNLERFVADYERENSSVEAVKKAGTQDEKIAVVGSGPAGLTCAADLAMLGYNVDLLEMLHDAGGVLRYGIPEFRLPKSILDSEVQYIEKLGVKLIKNMVVGKTLTIDEMLNGEYDAVFIGTGAGLPYFLNLPGENLNGVYSANEFLTRSNLMKAYLFPEYDTPINIHDKVAVIGGGNVAMDSARTALRLGAEKVYVVYRRSMEEMPARNEEIENAREEGLIFKLLTNPNKIHGEDGWVTGMECIEMELGEPDESGRRRPIPIEGSEFDMELDMVIIAIGQGPNPLLTEGTPELATNDWGNIKADPDTGETNMEGVYAGGDIVTGGATVIAAMGAGKRSARSIDSYLKKKR